ncbi:MAG: 1,4-dihydroxy-2-naphthoate polyprenyltransferase [Rubrobacter sp.]|nr:1,4-dihydroxy-2-naphthoate polyprenyltransferase [Rubrobacter sp.]
MPDAFKIWIEASRPKTLTAAVAPVLVGTAAASAFSGWRFLGALVVALAVQVGVNYANDYFDGVGGVDTEARIGPRRAVASGLVSPAQMRSAMLLAFGVAALIGLALAAVAGWWLVAVGAACFLAAVGYSGGSRPYASSGLGEVFVFVFFGLVATVGSAFVQDGRISWLAVVAAVPVGMLAVAILVANNLRDIETDARAGKRTLAVRLGDRGTRIFFLVFVLGPFVFVPVVAAISGSLWPLIALLAIALAPVPARAAWGGAKGRALIPVLAGTARLQISFGLLLAAGLLLA